MLMPIVSMNKMAMNESVATSCCWRNVTTAHKEYPEILHGGYVGTAYVEKYVTKTAYAGMSKTLFNLPYDYKGNGLTEPYISAPIYYDPDTTPGIWRYVGDEAPVHTEHFGKACKHEDGYCEYLELSREYRTNQHMDSTSKHGNITKWAEPHTSMQYSS